MEITGNNGLYGSARQAILDVAWKALDQRTIWQRKTGYLGCGMDITGHNGLYGSARQAILDVAWKALDTTDYSAAQYRLSWMWHGNHWTQRTIGQRKTGCPGCGIEITGHNGLYGSARQAILDVAILDVAWKALDTTDYMAAQDRLSWMWHGNHWTQRIIWQHKTGCPGCGIEITGHNGLYGSARQAILDVAWKALDTTDYMEAQDRLSWMWHGKHWTKRTIGQRKKAILDVAWKSLDTTDYMAAQDRLSWVWHGKHWTQRTIEQRKTGYPGCSMEITGHNGL